MGFSDVEFEQIERSKTQLITFTKSHQQVWLSSNSPFLCAIYAETIVSMWWWQSLRYLVMARFIFLFASLALEAFERPCACLPCHQPSLSTTVLDTHRPPPSLPPSPSPSRQAVSLWDEYHPAGWTRIRSGACPNQCDENSESYNRPISYSWVGPNVTVENVGQIVSSTTRIQYSAIPIHDRDSNDAQQVFEGCQHQPKCLEYEWKKSEASMNGDGLASIIIVIFGAIFGCLLMGVLLDTGYISNRWCVVGCFENTLFI